MKNKNNLRKIALFILQLILAILSSVCITIAIVILLGAIVTFVLDQTILALVILGCLVLAGISYWASRYAEILWKKYE